MGTTHQEEQQHVNPPPLPPREDGGPVQHMPMRTDGIGNADSGAGVGAGVESHGPPHLRRGDYASGAAGENTQTHAGHNTHPETTSTGANVNAGSGAGGAGVEKRSTGAKVRESASGVKGLVAAVHGAGETLRGTFNKEVDRAFHDVCDPSSSSSFPSALPSASCSCSCSSGGVCDCACQCQSHGGDGDGDGDDEGRENSESKGEEKEKKGNERGTDRGEASSPVPFPHLGILRDFDIERGRILGISSSEDG